MIVPIEIFLSFIAISFAVAVIAFLPRNKQPFLIILSGFMIAFWGITTDTIILGVVPHSSTVSGSTTTYIMENNEYEFTQWPKILLGLMGSLLFLAGGIIWNQERKSD